MLPILNYTAFQKEAEQDTGKQARWKSSRAEGRGHLRSKGQVSEWLPSYHLSRGGNGGGEKEPVDRMSWSIPQFPFQGSWNASLLPRNAYRT